MTDYNSLSDNERFKKCLDALTPLAKMSETKPLYSNALQRNRIHANNETVIKCGKISAMIVLAQYYKDGAINSQLEIPEMFAWYSEVETYWQKVIERLSNWLNNTASEIHY